MMRNKTGKWFAFLLYPENNMHCDILNYLLDTNFQNVQGFRTIGMMHDRSVYTTGTKTGQHKKTHIHIMIKTDTPHTSNAIAKMLGGSRPVLRLMQRDYMSQHTTKISKVKDENGNELFARQFVDSTGEEFPVLVDDGSETKSTIDLEIPSEVWTILESNHNWDSLPSQFYNNSDYPQFKCADNQYWKIVQRQDITHVEVVSDAKAYYLYLQHKDIASVRAGKEQYSVSEFFGSSELLKFLSTPNTLKYQLQTLLNLFSANNVKNGKQALELLSYQEGCSDMLEFYWANVSKFSAYFRGLEQEEQIKIMQSEEEKEPSINYTHKARREREEYYQEHASEKAKELRKEYPELIAEGKKNGFGEQIRNRLKDIANWFANHPEQTLHYYPSPEETALNDALKEYAEMFHVEHFGKEERETPKEFAEPALIKDMFDDYQDLMSIEDYQNIT